MSHPISIEQLRRRARVLRPSWLDAFDLAAVAVFAWEGATIARGAGMNALGIVLAAFATGLFGGIMRDLLLGRLVPATLRTVRYPAVALAAGGLVCLLGDREHAVPSGLVTILDAGGLGLCCVTGALTALTCGAGAFVATLLGAMTAVGGGAVRDLLLDQVPTMLRVNLYVVAAGAAVTVAAVKLGRSRPQAMAAGAVVASMVCLLAAWEHWGLPIPHA
ncbi:MAG TPA: TRIC cation channel family protein [Jatrophihabitantaceae bacterium]